MLFNRIKMSFDIASAAVRVALLYAGKGLRFKRHVRPALSCFLPTYFASKCHSGEPNLSTRKLYVVYHPLFFPNQKLPHIVVSFGAGTVWFQKSPYTIAIALLPIQCLFFKDLELFFISNWRHTFLWVSSDL